MPSRSADGFPGEAAVALFAAELAGALGAVRGYAVLAGADDRRRDLGDGRVPRAVVRLPGGAALGVGALGPVERLRVAVAGLPPKTDFDFFVIQVPTAPFGLAWYQGDIETDSHGDGYGQVLGRFSIETFIVAPGIAPAPQIFNKPPFPDASSNPATPPVQLYHLA